MNCVLCGNRIDTSDSNSFEEVGQIEFAHVECVEDREREFEGIRTVMTPHFC